MANSYIHPSVIAAEFLMHLEDALIIAPLCGIDKTSDFTQRSNGYKVGDQIQIKTQGEFETKEFTAGGNVEIQPVSSSTRPMNIEKHFDTSVEFGAREKLLDLDSLSDQVIRPAAYSMAAKTDMYLATKILESAGLYTSANLMGTAADVAQMRKAATLQQLNPSGRFALLDMDLEATALGLPAFNQAQTRGDDGTNTLRTGQLGYIMGIDWKTSINFPTNLVAHSAGTGAALTNTSASTNLIGQSVLTIDGGSGTLVVGDRIAIAGVRRPMKVATAVADLSSATEIVLVDPITEIVPNDAAVSVIGAGSDLTYQGAIFDDRTIGCAFPMLEQPSGADSYVVGANGISIRMVEQYSISNKVTTCSFDMLCGATMVDPRRGTLLASAA